MSAIAERCEPLVRASMRKATLWSDRVLAWELRPAWEAELNWLADVACWPVASLNALQQYVCNLARDALDETGKNFLRSILGRVFHTLNSRDASPNVAA
jgi:hypothetical protein